MERRGASMRGAWPPRRTLLPWNSDRWSIGTGVVQSSIKADQRQLSLRWCRHGDTDEDEYGRHRVSRDHGEGRRWSALACDRHISRGYAHARIAELRENVVADRCDLLIRQRVDVGLAVEARHEDMLVRGSIDA